MTRKKHSPHDSDTDVPTLSEEQLQKILSEEDALIAALRAQSKPGSVPPPSVSPPPHPVPADASASRAAGPAAGPAFSEVYSHAGVRAPSHGFSSEWVASALSSPKLASLPLHARLASVRHALGVAGVTLQEVADDAHARARALGEYESRWSEEVERYERERSEENAALEAEIAAFVEPRRARIEANLEAVRQAREALAEWTASSRSEVRRLDDAVRPLEQEAAVRPR